MARTNLPPRTFRITIGGVSTALGLTTITIVVAHGAIPLLAFLAAPPLLVLLLRMGLAIEEGLVLIAILVVTIALSLPGVSGHNRGAHQERASHPTSNQAEPARLLLSANEQIFGIPAPARFALFPWKGRAQ